MDLLPGNAHHLIAGYAPTNSHLDWAAHLIGNHDNIRTYAPYARQAYDYVSLARSYILPIIDQVSRKPDLATIALLLVIFFISLKLLNMLWQTVMFWFNLARRLLFWGGLVVLGLWMYTRGPEGVQEDVQYWMGVWTNERDYWKERERAARMANQVKGRGGGRNGGWF